MSVTGIILSGGRSTRMGEDKGFIEIQGKPMIQHVIDHIKPICDQLMISANHDAYEIFDFPVIPDRLEDCGPAGGIVSCLPYSLNKKNIIISCDMPFASTALVHRMLFLSKNYEITVAEYNGFLHPLCGIYLKDIHAKFNELVVNGQFKMNYLIQQFELNILDESEFKGVELKNELRNINRKEDIENING